MDLSRPVWGHKGLTRKAVRVLTTTSRGREHIDCGKHKLMIIQRDFKRMSIASTLGAEKMQRKKVGTYKEHQAATRILN
jgi:hypothetical protein